MARTVLIDPDYRFAHGYGYISGMVLEAFDRRGGRAGIRNSENRVLANETAEMR